jgi:hypothetical protein
MRNREHTFWTSPLPSLLACASLVASCVVWSRHKQLWADEVFTFVEFTDRSFVHLLRSAPRLGGAGMPLFYLTGWPWTHLFGSSPLALRMYSCLAMGAAFVILYRALRQRWQPAAAFLGIAFAMFSNSILLDQNAEARSYGLYLLLAALAIACWLRVADDLQPSPHILLLLALSQAGLALAHILGLAFCGILLAALVVSDWLQFRRLRVRVYAAFLAGWFALLLWLPGIRSAMAAGKPHGWIPVPDYADLTAALVNHAFAGFFMHRQTAGGVCFLAVATSIIALFVNRAASLHSRANRPATLLGFALALSPVAFFVVSRVASPIFVPRYMLPAAFGFALLLAGWLDSKRMSSALIGGLTTLALLLPLATALFWHADFLDVATAEDFAHGQPLIADWGKDFLVTQHYARDPASIFYPMDWPTALQGAPDEVPDYHLLQAYRANGYLSANIQDLSTLLRMREFAVLDNSQSNWFLANVQNNPCFAWKFLGQVDATHRVLAVQRVCR